MKHFNTKNRFNCTSIIIKYRVPSNFKLSLILINIKVYENDKYINYSICTPKGKCTLFS